MEILLKNKKPLKIAMLVGNALVLALIVLVCFTNAVHVADKGYKGWEVIFYGPAQGFAYGQYNFKTNWFTAIVTGLSLLAVLLTDYEWRDLKKKARIGFLGTTAVLLVVFAICMFALSATVKSVASPNMLTNIKYAITDNNFGVNATVIITGIIALFQAALCGLNVVLTLKDDTAEAKAE